MWDHTVDVVCCQHGAAEGLWPLTLHADDYDTEMCTSLGSSWPFISCRRVLNGEWRKRKNEWKWVKMCFWKQLNVKRFYNNSFWNVNAYIHGSFERRWVEFVHKVVSFSWQWLNGLYLGPAKSCIHSQWMCFYIMQITQIYMPVN